MRHTIKEQVQLAINAYIRPLSDTRFIVYLQGANGKLEKLWPSNTDPKEAKKEFISGMIYSRNKKYYAYHFHLTGYGYSKTYEIEHELKKINPRLIVEVI